VKAERGKVKVAKKNFKMAKMNFKSPKGPEKGCLSQIYAFPHRY
jgi:hypothetical protein